MNVIEPVEPMTVDQEFDRDFHRLDVSLRVGKFGAAAFVISTCLAVFSWATLLSPVMTAAGFVIARVSLVVAVIGLLVYGLYWLKLNYLRGKMK